VADSRPALRLDVWLFRARFFRSRSLAVAMLAGGVARLNGQHVSKPGAQVAAGDVLTFPQGDRIRVVRILALGLRRGPAAEAQALYQDLDAATPGRLE
jgi:ribosome-associated heat shock protein Hsp15